MSVFKEEQEQKFISVYKSYIDEIYQYIYLRIGLNQALAEDITQEVFFDVYKGLSRFKGLCSERTWIFKITKNKINDFYRKQYASKFELAPMDDNIAEQLEDPSQDIEKIMMKSFEREKVRACLEGLPEQYKIVLVLKYMDERSVKDIAFDIGKSPKAIESALQRAKTVFIKNYIKFDEKEDL